MMMESPKTKPEEETRTLEIIGWIDDLLIQIFVHLPLKPLFRFKLVSKHWNSIISDTRFELMRCQQTHNNNNNRAVGLFFQVLGKNFGLLPPLIETRVVSFFNDTSRSSNPQNRVIPDQTLRIFHSCNGLLVLFAKHDDQYYVYNPTTKQITAPLLKDDVIKARPMDRVLGMYLAFDPTKSPHHYKVVCVWELSRNFNDGVCQYQFEVYSSETHSWEIRGGYDTQKIGYVDFENTGVYWNGAIHWLGYFDGKSIYFNPDDDDDDDDEVPPRVMPTPPIHKGWSYFGESCGHLHCVVLVVDDDDDLARKRGIYVYEMRRDYSEWFLKFRVVHDDDNSHLFFPNIRIFICVARGNKDEDSFLVLGTARGEIIRYDLVHKTCETIANDAFRSMRISFHQYIESPCSV